MPLLQAGRQGCACLRSCEEVHLQKAGLQVTLGWSVVLQSIEQERGALLDHVHLHEHIHHLRGERGREEGGRERGARKGGSEGVREHASQKIP